MFHTPKGFLLAGLLVTFHVGVSWGLPTGSPAKSPVCTSLIPEHGVDAETSASPYRMSLNKKDLNGGETLVIKLEAPQRIRFQGFLVAVKVPGNARNSVGSFKIVDSRSKGINCFEKVNSSATHVSKEEKTNVTLHWIAPNENIPELQVVYTVLQTFEKFWHTTNPIKISVKRDPRINTPVKTTTPPVDPEKTDLSGSAATLLRKHYSECVDGAHGCMGIPDGCIHKFLKQDESDDAKPDCTVMLSWTMNGDKNSYKLSGKPGTDNGYIAMGFSDDNKMGKDSVVGCYGTRAGVVVQRFHNPERYNTGKADDMRGLVKQVAKFVDGHIFCEFDQTDHSIESVINVTIRESKYHILLAKGREGDADALHEHDFQSEDIGVSDEKVGISTVKILGKVVEESNKAEGVISAASTNLEKIYSECQDGNHGCMGIPTGCIETFLHEKKSEQQSLCTVLLTWTVQGNRNVYKLTGNPQSQNGYIAMGFSDDASMGTDSVVGCYRTDKSLIAIRRFKNPKDTEKYNTAHENYTLGLSNLKAAEVDGKLFCEFDQTDHTIEDAMEIQIRNSKYHILLARGKGGNEKKLPKHASTVNDIGVSGEKLDVTSIGIVGAGSNLLIKLHGAFMIVAWLVCASTGMFTARYYKLTNTKIMSFNKVYWFLVHICCMFFTVFLTACGAVFIFIKKGGFYPADGKYWHPWLGIILFGLAGFQVLIAILRPHPGTQYRPLFNWVHWIVGNSAHIVGIACILLAYGVDSAGLDMKYLAVGVVAVVFHVMMHLTLSFHTYLTDKEMGVTGEVTRRAVFPGPMKSNGLTTEAPGTSFRMLMMALYAIGLAGCAIALITFIWIPQEHKETDS